MKQILNHQFLKHRFKFLEEKINKLIEIFIYYFDFSNVLYGLLVYHGYVFHG